MDQFSKWETKPLRRFNFIFTLLGTVPTTSLSSSKKHSIMLLACTLLHLYFAEIIYLYSSRFKLLFPLFWTTSFRKYKRQAHFQHFFLAQKNRWGFSPKYAIGIWPGVKTCPNRRRTEQLWGQGAGHKLPKPRRLCRSDSLRSKNSSEENKRQGY